MSDSFKVKNRLNINPKASPTLDSKGDVAYDSGTDVLKYYDGAEKTIATTANVATTQTALDAHIADSSDAHAASAITNTPSGNLSATTVQGALNELQTDLDNRATSAALSAHESDTSTHGVTEIVGTSEAQSLTNKTINADSNTITNIENADIKAAAAIDATKIADGSVTNAEFQYIGSLTSDAQTQLDAKVAKSIYSAKGSIAIASAASTPADLTVGTNGHVLTADSGETTGVKWQAVAVSPIAVLSKTGTYTATTSDDLIKCDATSGAFTINLYAASGNSGRRLKVVKTDTSVNAVTVDGNSSETINGNTTVKLAAQYDYLEIICDGSNWLVENGNLTSEICLDSGNGHGSTTGTKIRRFTNTRKSIGSGITYADSSTDGGSFTINEAGVYSISYNDKRAGGGFSF